MDVRISKMGGALRTVKIKDGSTWEQTVTASKLAVEGFEVRVNGMKPCANKKLKDGDIIALIPRIKGGV